jgi:hypothetical protein
VMRIRQLNTIYEWPAYTAESHQWWTGPWNDSIIDGSGRPAWVATNDGNLYITGVLSQPWTTSGFYSLRADVIQPLMTPYGETMESQNVPLTIDGVEDPDPPVEEDAIHRPLAPSKQFYCRIFGRG